MDSLRRNLQPSKKQRMASFRNGKVSDATTIFQKFRTTCAPCAWRSGLSLIDAGIPENLVKISDCVLCVQIPNTFSDSAPVSVMAISKFLHFFNPMLFPICDLKEQSFVKSYLPGLPTNGQNFVIATI